ncbi:hypothetical protein IPG41_01825 [Candidatus Peregrinibacteria bacterium]|nr:MAG: hypothetical protein IPG41_01825 [Candidatus Peregrinibacteria bacterium]
MNRLPSIQKLGFFDPWEIQRAWQLQLRYNERAMAEEGMTEGDRLDIQRQYDNNKAEGKRTFELADHTLDREGKEKKEFLTTALKRFQDKTGINEEKYITRVEEAISMSELKELEMKFKKTGIQYYKEQINKSGLFIPIDHRETAFVNDEKKIYFDWIEKQPLDTEDSDEPSIIEALSNLQGHLDERREGRDRLKRQSSYVKDEFFRQLGAMGTSGSKDKLLEKILKSVGNLEKEPSSIQFEFKKGSKTAEGKKDTAALLKEVREEHEKKTKAYEGILNANSMYFGGKKVKTPKGEMREAQWEFMKWFQDIKKFSEMDTALEQLEDTVIPERKAVYQERNELVNALPEPRKTAILNKTNEMRLHTLKAYLKEAGGTNLEESAIALEYIAELETAEYDGYPLFTNDEKRELRKAVQKSKPELQEAELKVLLGRLIPTREAEVRDYLNLSVHLKDDQKFFTANVYEKRKFMREAIAKQNRELQHPFDIDNLKDMSQEEKMSTLLTKLQSREGQRDLKSARKELSQEGKTQRTDTQLKVMDVMSNQWKNMRTKGLTQPENYMTEIYKGAKVNNSQLWRGAWQTGVARDEHQQYMADTARTDFKAYLSLRGRTWGGNAVKIGKVTKEELSSGRGTIMEKLKEAKWAENMLFLNGQGEDELHPDDMLADFLAESLGEEADQIILKVFGIDPSQLPVDFKQRLIQVAIIGENGGIFKRAHNGAQIIRDAVN